MAKDSKEEKKGGLWRYLDDVLLAGLLLPFLKGFLEKFSAKFGKEVEEAFGMTAESAEVSDDDEILFDHALAKGGFDKKQKTEIRNYLGRLRKKNPKLASEFTRRIHNVLYKFAEDRKTITGTKESKETREWKDYQRGIEDAKDLLVSILEAPDDDKREEILTQIDIKVREKPKKKSLTRKTFNFLLLALIAFLVFLNILKYLFS